MSDNEQEQIDSQEEENEEVFILDEDPDQEPTEEGKSFYLNRNIWICPISWVRFNK